MRTIIITALIASCISAHAGAGGAASFLDGFMEGMNSNNGANATSNSSANSTSSSGPRAVFTGRSEFATSVTGQQIHRCEYNIYGNTFWMNFRGGVSCPTSVPVQ
jgi:hypothetical protein